MDKVAVLICNYNHEKWLKEAIISIVNQSHSNFEIIVIDDGSDIDPKDTVMSIETKDLALTYFRNEINHGKWACLNYAMGQTDAKYFMIQDADDFAFKWKLKAQMEVIKQTNTLVNLAGYVELRSNQKLVVPSVSLENIHTVPSELILRCANISATNSMINHNYTGDFKIHNGASLISRDLYDVGFRFNPPNMGLRVARSEDSDYNLRVTRQFHRVSWTTLPCYAYRLDSGHPEGSF
jgi:glycosyltransferase involved in cell wall biosynthesis